MKKYSNIIGWLVEGCQLHGGWVSILAEHISISVTLQHGRLVFKKAWCVFAEKHKHKHTHCVLERVNAQGLCPLQTAI